MKYLIVMGFAFLISCNSSDNSTTGEIDGTSQVNNSWVLASYENQTGSIILAVENVPFSFTYIRDDQSRIIGFTGYDGCNAFSSQGVMQEGDNIMPVNGVNVDGASCDNLQFAEYLQQFDFFYSVISNTFVSIELNETLSLTSMNGDILSFEPCVLVDPNSLDSACEPI